MADAVMAMEDQASEIADRVLALVQARRSEELVGYMNGLDRGELSLVVLAVGTALLDQEESNDELEVRNGILRIQNETLEAANVALFRERRVLTEKVQELRNHLDAQALALPPGKGRRRAA